MQLTCGIKSILTYLLTYILLWIGTDFTYLLYWQTLDNYQCTHTFSILNFFFSEFSSFFCIELVILPSCLGLSLIQVPVVIINY